MTESNFHTHTSFCDGNDTPEELIKKALEKGCKKIGFSGHSYTAFDESYCMSREGTELYKKEIRALKEKYSGQIEILLGVEQDYFSKEDTSEYDYVIGSVHYVKKDGLFFPIDLDKESFVKTVNEHYGGDFYALSEDYYALLSEIYEKTKCDIIGHFDLVTKYNEKNNLFDTRNERYINAAYKAIDALCGTGALIEINTGAIARGLREEPYPEELLREYMNKKGFKFIKSSDCHNKEKLLFGFEKIGFGKLEMTSL